MFLVPWNFDYFFRFSPKIEVVTRLKRDRAQTYTYTGSQIEIVIHQCQKIVTLIFEVKWLPMNDLCCIFKQ